MKPLIKLFLSGAMQVFFVAINTIFITKYLILHVFVVGFLISFIWSFNVKRVAFGTTYDRIAYSLGAASGGIIGMMIGKLITT